MGRWEPGARDRLAQAALELYRERGFEQTTAADIAARAGLTERTFFRHFADKREVLFGGSGRLQELVVGALAAAPEGTPPLDGVVGAFQTAAPFFEERREGAAQRAAVVAASAELRERELIKLASLGAALAGTLRERGVAEPAASLTAEAGVAVFRIGFERWVGDPDGRPMPEHLRESLDQLRAVTAAG
jgi:AcrR family transcriptional regulator